jgi:hypothetical protein
MGKRSDFTRLPRDYYRTIDPRAVQALKPFVTQGSAFVEPCAGDGILTDQLVEVLKLKCIAEYDIEPDNDRVIKKDALTIEESDVIGADIICTNPPWDRKLLHPMIERFVSLRPTFLLFDANWVWTKQSSRFINLYCTDIIAIGRLKWIENTTMSGKDDNAWFRFDLNKQGDTKFHGR